MQSSDQHNRPLQFSIATLLILTTALAVWLAMNQGASTRQISWMLLFLAPQVLGQWWMFEKAGLPGWGAVVPIYNLVLLIRVAQRPAWWILLYIVPIFNLIPFILVPLSIARNFGKSGFFAAGLIFLGFIFYPILGFGPANYQVNSYVRFHAGEPYVC